MTIGLTALLFLGLSLGPRTPVQAGTLPKPRLWAEPSSVITYGQQVTIWCEGTLGALEYHLYREGKTEPWDKEIPQETKNKAKFYIHSATEHRAGRYHCYYRSPAGWSEPSDTLELVVTDAYTKPRLSAWAKPAVDSDDDMNLQCDSRQIFERFILTEEEHQFSWTLDSELDPNGWSQAVFSMNPMTPGHKWVFRCSGFYRKYPHVWSKPSEPLEIMLPGTLPKPQLWAEPSYVISLGSTVTMWCEGPLEAQMYHLSEEGSPLPKKSQTPLKPGNKAKFSIPSMTEHHVVQYHCYYHSPAGWSEPSDPLELVVTGAYSKPRLSALPSPVVAAGGNVTLQCGSWLGFDRFILTEGEEHKLFQTLDSQPQSNGEVQAMFPVGPVTPSQRQTFKCYGYYRDKPRVWSAPSDPLELQDSGLGRHLNLLIGVSVAFLLLLGLGLLFVFLRWRHRCQGTGKKAAQGQADSHHPAEAAELAPETSVLHKSSSPAATAQEEHPYADVKSRQPEDRVELDSQVAASEDAQEVTYAQVCSWTLREGTPAPPPSREQESSAKPIVYAALASSLHELS